MVTIPYLENSIGMAIFDMRPMGGYSIDTGRALLESISITTKDYYINYQLVLDIFYPLFQTLFAISLLGVLSKHYKVSNVIGGVFAIGILLGDYAENIMIFLLLKGGFEYNGVIFVANCFTLMKSFSTMIFYTLITIMGIRGYLLTRQRKATT